VLAIGEFQFRDIPARVRTTIFEPPVAWRAARGAGTPARVAVAMRQANAGVLLHNPHLADWSRHTDAPFAWTPRMVRVWMDWARAALRPVRHAGRIDPNVGGPWIYTVGPPGRPRRPRVPFLPGAEPALAFASLAAAHGRHAEALERFADAAARLPDLAHLDALRGASLLRADRPEEAYRRLAVAEREGVLTLDSLTDLAVAAARTGRRAAAEAAWRRAAALLPRWADHLRETRRRMEAAGD
jgi:hypothetical protein